MTSEEKMQLVIEMAAEEQRKREAIEDEFGKATWLFNAAQTKRHESLKALRNSMGRAYDAIAKT